MALDNFRRVNFKIDRANDNFLDTIYAKVGDQDGRELVVQLTNNGVVEDQTGVQLKLAWTHSTIKNKGFNSFKPLDLAQGIFSVTLVPEMMNAGQLDAVIQIIADGRITNTRNFKIVVENSPMGVLAVVDSDSFTALNDSLLEVNQYKNIVDEVQKARSGKVDLDARLITDKQDIQTKLDTKRSKSVLLTQSDLSTASESHKLTMNHLSQEVKNAMTGTAPVSPNIADKSITQFKTVEPLVVSNGSGKNLYDDSRYVHGIFFNPNTGAEMSISDGGTSGFIELDPRESHITVSGYGKYMTLSFWDKDKNHCGGSVVTSTHTIPNNAKYVRLAVDASARNTLQIEYGKIATSYEYHEYKLSSSDIAGPLMIENLSQVAVSTKKNVNLFDKSKATSGWFFSATGQYVVKADTYCSEPIKLKYHFGRLLMNETGYLIISFWDERLKFISGVTNDANPVIPEGAVYAYITVKDTHLNTATLVHDIENTTEDLLNFVSIQDFAPLEQDPTNMFNPDLGYTKNAYYSYENGLISYTSPAQHIGSTPLIELEPNQNYMIQANNQLVIFKKDRKTFSRGFIRPPSGGIVTADDEGFISIAFDIADVDIVKIEKGTEATPVGKKINRKYLPSVVDGYELTVGKDETAMYSTITDAVTASKNGDVIKVRAGVYDENVRLYGKNVSIIGEDKTTCILKNGDGRYSHPPLEMSAGVLKNMTVHAYRDENSVQVEPFAYGIHIDHTTSTNKTLRIDNCKIISESNASLGIGMWANFKLEVTNCELITDFKAPTENWVGGLFIHDRSSSTEIEGQYAKFHNNVITNTNGHSLRIKKVGLNSTTKPLIIEFVNNAFYSESLGKDSLLIADGVQMVGNRIGSIEIHKLSHGNSIPSLNIE